MPLPDVSPFATLDGSCWRDLGHRLREIGLTTAAAEPIAAIADGLPPERCGPLRRWHLARMHDPVAWAMRLLMFDDAISPAEAGETFGASLLSRVLEAQ